MATIKFDPPQQHWQWAGDSAEWELGTGSAEIASIDPGFDEWTALLAAVNAASDQWILDPNSTHPEIVAWNAWVECGAHNRFNEGATT